MKTSEQIYDKNTEKSLFEFNCLHKRWTLDCLKIHPQKLALFYPLYDNDGKYPTYDDEVSPCQILVPKMNHACIQKQLHYNMVNIFLGYFMKDKKTKVPMSISDKPIKIILFHKQSELGTKDVRINNLKFIYLIIFIMN